MDFRFFIFCFRALLSFLGNFFHIFSTILYFTYFTFFPSIFHLFLQFLNLSTNGFFFYFLFNFWKKKIYQNNQIPGQLSIQHFCALRHIVWLYVTNHLDATVENHNVSGKLGGQFVNGDRQYAFTLKKLFFFYGIEYFEHFFSTFFFSTLRTIKDEISVEATNRISEIKLRHVIGAENICKKFALAFSDSVHCQRWHYFPDNEHSEWNSQHQQILE